MRKSSYSEPCTRGPSPPWLWCFGCYENRKGRSHHPRCLYSSVSKPHTIRKVGYPMKRESPAGSTAKGAWTCPDPHFLKLYPDLAQGMCDCWWDDGKPRICFKLSVGFDEGRGTSLTLSDKGGDRYAFTNAETLSDALNILNTALAAGTVAWRKNRK